MVKYNSLQECQAAIDTLKTLGVEPPTWMTDQLEAFRSAKVFMGIYPQLCSRLNYSGELKDCIESTVKKLVHPADGFSRKEPGLLLGKIQSGKTRAFVGIIGKMFDEGADIAIVLEKGTRALTEQTISRMEHDFADFLDRGVLDRPVVEVHDILKIRNGLTKQELKDKNIIVCKKQKDNLKRLNDILGLNGFLDKKIVIIDDEADFASRNYQVKNGDVALAVIANQIDELVAGLKDCFYLQVTATPYSMYLQPDGYIDLSNGGTAMPFKPRFTELLPIYEEYIGGKHYFDFSRNPDSMYSCLHRVVREECRAAMAKINRRYLKNMSSSPNMRELREAVLGYFVGSSIRRIQERKLGANYMSSCIIHVEIAKDKHDYQSQLVMELLDQWSSQLRMSKGNIPVELKPLFDSLYTDYCDSISKGIKEGLLVGTEIPPKADVWVELASLILNEEYSVRVVNSNEDVASMLDRNGQLKLTHPVNIFVGGQILDRGITISNLICFFYGRNPQRLQQDTVLQHSRMYGNRSKVDMAVTRFYTTQRLHDVLSQIHFLDEELRNWLKEYSEDPTHDPSLSVVFRGDRNVIPCSPGKLAVSDCVSLRANQRMLPVGFQTGARTNIQEEIAIIDRLIETCPGFENRDANGFFEMDYDTAEAIIRHIRNTYIYDRPIDNNKDLDWNENEMLTALQYASGETGGKLWCLHRGKGDRDLSRMRPDGSGFSNAPDDGRSDLPLSRAKAVDRPVLMLIKEQGRASKGWRDAEFYWPVLYTQANLKPVVFTAKTPK